MKNKTVYCVVRETGGYGDYWTVLEAIFSSMEKAIAYRKKHEKDEALIIELWKVQ